MKKLKVVDYLRGFSIFTIVLMHLLMVYPLPSIVQKAIAVGGAGVHVFILCSGFGLYLSYLNKPLKYKDFLKRRFTKVYLPYVLVVLISAIYGYAVAHEDVLLPLLSHVFLFKMFVPSLESSFGGQMWFISTIIQFYLVWPLVVLLFKRSGMLASLGISLLWILITTFTGLYEERIWNSFFATYLWEFTLGMYLADRYVKEPSFIRLPSKWKLLLLTVFGLGISGVCGLLGGYYKSFNDIPSMIGYISMALFIYKLNTPYLSKFFEYTNKVSYEWYLLHILIFGIYHRFCGAHLPMGMECVVVLSLSYIASIAYYRILKVLKIR